MKAIKTFEKSVKSLEIFDNSFDVVVVVVVFFI